MNEELQSTNEELRTINDQMHQSAGALNRVNFLLESILGRMEVAVAVLEEDLTIAVWSPRAEELWGLRRDEVVGTAFFKLDIGIPLAPLRALVEQAAAADGERVMTVEGVNRRGRRIECRVTCRTLDRQAGDGRLLLVMEERSRNEGS